MEGRIMKKLLTIFFSALLVCSCLISYAAEPVTLKITSWFDPATMGQIYEDAWQIAADELGYNVIVDSMDSISFQTKYKVQLASGELTDILTMWFALTHVEMLIQAGAIIPMDQHMAESGLQFQPAQLRPYYKDGVNYIIPVTTGNAFFIYYNKEMVEEMGLPLPETMQDIETIIKMCDAQGKDAFGLALKDRWLGDFLWMALVSREDPTAFARVQNGETDFLDPSFVNAANTAVELVKMGAFPKDVLNITVPEMAEMFFAGRFPFMIEGGWRWSKLQNMMGDNLGYIRFPKTGSDENYKETILSNPPFGLIVSKDSQHVAEATQLCLKYAELISNYLAERGMMNFLVNDTKPIVATHPAYQQLMDDTAQVKNVVPSWSDEVSAELCEKWYDLAQALFGGLITAEEYLNMYNDAYLEYLSAQ
jgi:raffinose/stachyose/melibiose transport system substrate-binding protein